MAAYRKSTNEYTNDTNAAASKIRKLAVHAGNVLGLGNTSFEECVRCLMWLCDGYNDGIPELHEGYHKNTVVPKVDKSISAYHNIQAHQFQSLIIKVIKQS